MTVSGRLTRTAPPRPGGTRPSSTWVSEMSLHLLPTAPVRRHVRVCVCKGLTDSRLPPTGLGGRAAGACDGAWAGLRTRGRAAGPPGEALCLDWDVAEGKMDEEATAVKRPRDARDMICACAPVTSGKLWVPSREAPQRPHAPHPLGLANSVQPGGPLPQPLAPCLPA